jgi:hypothetical protein
MRKDTCKHFNGLLHDKCEKLVPYDTWRNEGVSMLKTLPCMNKECKCLQREYPTQAEVDAYEKEAEESIAFIVAIDKAVSVGIEEGEVPHSCGGVIKWRRPAGTHLRARCTGCNLTVME